MEAKKKVLGGINSKAKPRNNDRHLDGANVLSGSKRSFRERK